MRIGIVARGLNVPVGGARRLLDALLRYLPRMAKEHEVVSYQPPGAPEVPGVTTITVSAPHAVWWEWVACRRAIRAYPPDVLIAPKTLLPPGLPRQIKSVSVVLDLLYFRIRNRYMHEYKWRDIAYNRLFYRAACRRAAAILCISEHTRMDLLDICPDLERDRVHVTPLGVDLPELEQVSAERCAAVRQAYGLERPYIFYPGTLTPRKNMVRGVRAWAAAKRIAHVDLVVTAGKSWRDDDVEQTVDALGVRSRFKRLGEVDGADLPALYAGAEALFFPSLYEGFGLPILEAMACGCPVVASNATCLHEVVDTAGLLVDPLDEHAMATALERVLTEKELAERLRKAGQARAASLPWETCIEDIYSIVKRL